MQDGALDLGRLGSAVRRRRDALGWNPHRLAKRAGVADGYVRRVEAGDSRVGLEVVAKIAQALGLTVDDLVREAGARSVSASHSDLMAVYRELAVPEREAWLEMGHTLRELQGDYADMQRVAENRAAYDDREGIDAERAELEGMEPK